MHIIAAAVAAAVLLLVLLIWPVLPEQPVHPASRSTKPMNVRLDNRIIQEVTDVMCNMFVHVNLPRMYHGMLIAQP